MVWLLFFEYTAHQRDVHKLVGVYASREAADKVTKQLRETEKGGEFWCEAHTVEK